MKTMACATPHQKKCIILQQKILILHHIPTAFPAIGARCLINTFFRVTLQQQP